LGDDRAERGGGPVLGSGILESPWQEERTEKNDFYYAGACQEIQTSGRLARGKRVGGKRVKLRNRKMSARSSGEKGG